jgi:hypothetical protein
MFKFHSWIASSWMNFTFEFDSQTKINRTFFQLIMYDNYDKIMSYIWNMSQDVIHAKLVKEMENVNQYGIDVIKINIVTKLKCTLYKLCAKYELLWFKRSCFSMRCNLYEKMVILPPKVLQCSIVYKHGWVQKCYITCVERKTTKPSKWGIAMKSLAC